ncbi:MAG: hypothetical protein ABL903_08455 [Methylococcales bacterium]
MNITAKKLLEAMKKKGHPVATGELAINLIGIRATAIDGELFNDWLCVLFEKKGKQELAIYPATTDCEALFVSQRTGLQLPAGHYKNCWQLGVYRGRYATLVGTQPLGINLCHGEPDPYTLEKHHWSGVTQVMAHITDFHVVLSQLFEAASKHERTFSYTLLDEADVG